MATRFVRVDLADEARDFRPVAIEPGVPLLDRSNSNAKVLFRWLGGLLAEPVWEDDSVNFYARDDHGGRLEEVVCQPVAAADLQGLLKDDVAALKDRLEKAKPETPTERAVKKTIARCIRDLTENPNRTDLDDYFFRYRDAAGRWRLVWCWGYQRMDQEPAPAVVCTDPECCLLFVRRPGQSPKCPACEKALAQKPRRRRNLRRPALLLLLLLLLLACGYYWWTHPQRLVAEPDHWSGPVGSRIEFKVVRKGLFREEDVSRQAVPIILDPQIARLDPAQGAAIAASPGGTVVRFHLGNLRCDATLNVSAARNPDKLLVEPRNVELGIGTTARLKVVGQYDEGATADLTDAVQWAVEKDSVAFAHNGLLEGVSEGTTAVTAKYRATPDSPWMEAAATVSVAKIAFSELELAIDPLPVSIGQGSRLRIDAVSDEGKRYSVLESSLLATEVSPPYVAAVKGRVLRGDHVGSGKLAATFNEKLTAGAEFDVVVGSGVDRLTVYPEQLNLIVGEITDLSIVSPLSDPIKVVSARPSVVEVNPENRLIGRGEGTAQVEVTQGGEKRTVDVNVKKADLRAIALDPSRLVVPADDTLRARVMGRIEGDRTVEMSPDLVMAEKTPSPRYADFEPPLLRLRGVRPTEPSSPQTLAVRLGPHAASAPVEVIVAPMRLTLSPPGPIDLPVGQMMRLNGWAAYSGGRRVLVPSERLEWHSRPDPAAAPGLELRGNRVAALKAGAGPLPVYASYFGRESNRVSFKSVEAGPVTLKLDCDRSVRLAGETGAAVLSGTGPNGDVELVPELAAFKSSDEAIVRVDEKSGAFRAAAPGRATLSVAHPAAQQPAALDLSVYDPARARLVFQPNTARIAVDEVAKLPLYLEVKDGEKSERVLLEGPGVGYSSTQPQAIRWQPPYVTGLSPTKPFELTASYAPLLSNAATATIEVTPPVEPEAIRVVPPTASLAPGQSLTVRVEQLLPGAGDAWKEVRPDAVSWTVPPGLIWSPATADLRPALTIPDGAKGEYELRATYGGKRNAAVIAVKTEAPDPNAAGAKLVLVREPGGQFLPVGHQQRYQIMVEKDGSQEPAANVRWPEGFENAYVRWQPPVLSAKQGGHEQWLRAEVGGKAVIFRTYTYQPSQFERVVRPDQPVAVKILSDQITGAGQRVRFPVGAEFDDFRVEAHYADGFTRVVTKKALLRTPEPPESAPLTAANGRLMGVRPGTTSVAAEFDGVAAQQPLPAEVTAGLDVDQIRIAPAPVNMLRGETVALEAVGYKGGKSVGIITGLGKLAWQSSNPQVAQVNGPAVTGAGLGQANVTVSLGPIISQPTAVNVVDSIADALKIEPRTIRLRVGESVRIGTDVAVFRGEMDVGKSVAVSPVQPNVVQYVPETRSLVGVSPGVSAVAVALGDKLTNVNVEVVPGFGAIDGQVYVEPASGVLAPGQALDLRVYVVTANGSRVDRTESAVLTSSDPARVKLIGNKACAVAPGAANLTATLPGTQQTGQAAITVTNEEITELAVEPPRLDMSVGDTARLRVLGRAASGTHELYPQPDLTVAAGGPNAAAIRVLPPSDVNAAAEGQSSVNVGWKNRLTAQAPVNVANAAYTGLMIEPASATIYPNQAIAYQVTAMRGGQRRVLGPENGVQLFTGSQEIASPIGGMTVQGKAPGRTSVVAQLGAERAEAVLNVAEGTAPIVGTGVIGDGGGYVVDSRHIRDHIRGGRWIGGRWVGPGGVVDVVPEGVIGAVPVGPGAGLRFVPDVLRLAPNAPPTGVRVVEVTADGQLGRDVTADPQLELTEPPDVVKIEKGPNGPLLRPTGVGQTRVGARLGTLTADPLLVAVGDQGTGLARLEVAPDPLTIWSGEQGAFGSVRLNPGGGQLPFEVDYRVSPAPNQGIVAAAGEKMVRGLSPGTAQVTIAAVDPTGVYNNLSTVATVQVMGAERIELQPAEVTLQVGQAAPAFAAVARGADGLPYQVPAALRSTDENVLAPDPAAPGRFVAKGFGKAEVQATYRGSTAFAKVSVSGQRFLAVEPAGRPGSPTPESFDVTVQVLAAGSEGPLEYRVYLPGQPPPEAWVPAQPQGENLQATLRSPAVPFGARGSLYNLMIEARRTTDQTIERYPFTFRLEHVVERERN